MSKTYSAGIVTAYGAAKRAGYQGTYEDFCRQQAGYAENAAAVEQAKNTAVSAANTATTKAGEATTAATAAQTAKTQTEAVASQALTDISTARSGAISAVQTEGATQTANARAQAQAAAASATTASTKASEASASATSAGQSATNAAASATSAAQSASDAQDVLDSIQADYSEMSANVEQLKADLGGIKKNYTEKSKVALLSNVLANGDFHTAGGPMLYYNATGSVSNNVLTATGGSSANTVEIRYYMPALANKYVFCVIDVQVNDDSCDKLSLCVSGRLNRSEIVKPIKDKWYRIAAYYTGTDPSNQNLIFEVIAQYANSTTANGKTFNIKNAIAFYNDSDYGLGVKPPFYKLMNIVKTNDFWIGAKELTIEEYNYKYDTINNSQNSYVLPCRNAHQSLRRPIVTFVCDDGWYDDYYKLAPISEKHQVPFASAIFDGSTLTEWQEYYLQNELGWEFVSHPENAPLADKATESAIIKAMIDTNEYLTNRGLKYYNIVYPYGSSDERVRRLAKKYYRCGCTTNAGINTGVVPSFYLYRWPMGYGNGDNNTLDFFKSKVDATVAANGWLIFMLHPHMGQHTAALTQIIDDLITYIKSIDVEIMTLNDGYSIFGNALECGDYIGSTDGIAISFDGHTANI